MNRSQPPHTLFYPFHLCHPETLTRLLTRFATVHFRDFMALQLTPMSGVTAFQDRMGMSFQDLVESGRLVQGYDVSGPFSSLVAAAIDRDLHDPIWRATLEEGYLFEYGLALVKTSASLVYTQTLSLTHRLQPTTDSPAHFALYTQSCIRENWLRTNHLLTRTGY